ncbi:D-alanyl-D-alanine carboxypeptidase [Patescibacteria group bacterium]|nr:D-alanyl-D-alanine carboxypeptidase [Patescibacteria group bacterium]
MKKVAIFSAVLVVLLFVLLNIFFNKEKAGLVSPFLQQEKVLGINQWFPKQPDGNYSSAPDISAEAALFVETKSGQVLFVKNFNKRLPVASLVKVMTVLIVLEHKDLDSEFIVSQRAADTEPDKMLLIAGEKLTLKELLSGIFLISANDAAEVLAEGTTGDREEFIRLMNKKAEQLGMKNTHFANPTGLDEDSNNSYSTAYDLAVLTRYLIRRFPEVAEISKSEHVYLPQTENHQDYDMYSGINLLTTYPGVVGFKTGYTPEAGLTLVTLARKSDYEVLGVLLGSEDRRDEARELLDYSFDKLK